MPTHTNEQARGIKVTIGDAGAAGPGAPFEGQGCRRHKPAHLRLAVVPGIKGADLRAGGVLTTQRGLSIWGLSCRPRGSRP